MPYLMCPRCSYGFSTEHANLGSECPKCNVKLKVRSNPNMDLDTIEQGEFADRGAGAIYFILALIAVVSSIRYYLEAVDHPGVRYISGPSGPVAEPSRQGLSFMLVLIAVYLVISGIGMLGSKAWAHLTMLIFCGIAAPFLAVISPPLAMLAIPMVTFSLCRLAGIVGAKPVDSYETEFAYQVLPPPYLGPCTVAPEVVLPEPTGVAGEFEVWVSNVVYSRFNPPLFLEICKGFSGSEAIDDKGLFDKVRQASNWPMLILSKLGEDDAKKVAISLEQAGIETIVREGVDPNS